MVLKSLPSRATVVVHLYETICQWIFQTWKSVAKPAFIVSGFQQCRYIEWNGDYQKLHSRLCDMILNRTVPIEAILEVNEMLLELEEANEDVLNETYEVEDLKEEGSVSDKENEGSESDENDEDIMIDL